jgi:hypothetical protein
MLFLRLLNVLVPDDLGAGIFGVSPLHINGHYCGTVVQNLKCPSWTAP